MNEGIRPSRPDIRYGQHDVSSSPRKRAWKQVIASSIAALAIIVAIILSDHPVAIAAVMFLFGIFTIVDVGMCAILGRLWGISIENVSFFAGSKWARFSIGPVPVEIGWLPITGHTQFKDGDSIVVSPTPEHFLSDAPPWQRLLLAVARPCLLAAVGLSLLGWTADIRGFYEGLLAGTLSPIHKGSAIIHSFLLLMENGQFSAFAGELALALALLSILPIPPLNGGKMIVELFGPSERKRMVANVVGYFLIVAPFSIVWIVALVCTLYGSAARTSP